MEGVADSVPTAGNPTRTTHEQPHTPHRMVSQSVPSGLDLHPCVRCKHPTDHGAAGAPHLCNSPTLTQTDGITEGVPTVNYPTRSCPRTTCTALHSRHVVVEHTDVARKRACPSTSEIHAGIAEEDGLSLLLRRTPRHCEEEWSVPILPPPWYAASILPPWYAASTQKYSP